MQIVEQPIPRPPNLNEVRSAYLTSFLLGLPDNCGHGAAEGAEGNAVARVVDASGFTLGTAPHTIRYVAPLSAVVAKHGWLQR